MNIYANLITAIIQFKNYNLKLNIPHFFIIAAFTQCKWPQLK